MAARMKLKNTPGWQKKVYHPPEKIDPGNWKEVRNAVLARDLKCYRCGNRRVRSLTVHHLVPRSEGGGNNLGNLISLCNRCHDIVEMAGCRTLTDIDATLDGPEIIKRDENISDREETFERPAWHAWVYGGVKKPD